MATSMAISTTNGMDRLRNMSASTSPMDSMENSFTRPASCCTVSRRSYTDTSAPANRYASPY